MGGGARDKNFVGKFVLKARELIDNGIAEYAVGDRIWQPTYTLDLAKNTLLLLEHGKTGIWSMGSEGKASFYELATLITLILGIEDKLKITHAKMKNLEAIDIAKRPNEAILSNSQLHIAGLCIQRHWETALKEYLALPWFKKLFP